MKHILLVINMIVGFNFNKINIEKKTTKVTKFKVKNNVNIKEVDTLDLAVGNEKQKGVVFRFEFTSAYEPDVGKILLAGELYWMDNEKKLKEIINGWKKTKKLQKDILTPVMNTILTKCHIQAIYLSSIVNLPSPIPLPRIRSK